MHRLTAVMFFSLWAFHVSATPINVQNPYQFLDNRSANDAGLTTGPLMQIGAVRVSPNSNGILFPTSQPPVPEGTTGVATSGNLVRTLRNIDYSLNSFFYAIGVPCPDGICPGDAYDPWTLTFTNDTDTTVVQTLGVSASAEPLPFVRGVIVDPTGPQPVLSWSLPNVLHDAVALRIRDNNAGVGPAGPGCDPQTQAPQCVADLINVTYFPAGTESVTIPSSLYQPGGDYSIELNVIDLRNEYIATGPARNRIMFGDTQRMSRTYINFAALPDGSPAAYLPTPSLQPDGTPSYIFDVPDVVAGQTIFIDPLIAIGYDYAIGVGDPFFASVLLPTGIGDDIYEIIVNSIAYSVMGGVVFDFTEIAAGGIDAFRVLGIETSAMLDPFSPTAFVTGLTFVGDGSFTGTMTPITQFVPAPAPLALMGLGIFGLAYRRRWQRRTR